jgi:hypothetical protein
MSSEFKETPLNRFAIFLTRTSINSRKWQNHVVVPLEALGGRDLHQIQSEAIEAESQRRKTLEAKFASVPDLVVAATDDSEGKALTAEPESDEKMVAKSGADETVEVNVATNITVVVSSDSSNAHPHTDVDAATQTDAAKPGPGSKLKATNAAPQTQPQHGGVKSASRKMSRGPSAAGTEDGEGEDREQFYDAEDSGDDDGDHEGSEGSGVVVSAGVGSSVGGEKEKEDEEKKGGEKEGEKKSEDEAKDKKKDDDKKEEKAEEEKGSENGDTVNAT